MYKKITQLYVKMCVFTICKLYLSIKNKQVLEKKVQFT